MKYAILAMALLLPLPAYSDAITLDTSRSVGPTVSIATPSGISCSETAGDRPSLWLGGRIREQATNGQQANPWTTTTAAPSSSTTYINSNLFNDEQGYSVGVGIHVPFGGPPTGNCRRFVAVAQREAYISILDKMLKDGTITKEEYKTLLYDLLETFKQEIKNKSS
jgi:hypothetical protein